MRRDAYLYNDSGGLSVIAAAAIDDIIEDGSENDEQFVQSHHAILLGLVGDDSLPIRVVVDEPLSAVESAEWLGRVRWRLNVPDGRLLVAGGFDPDVFDSWREEGEHEGVAEFDIPPGTWMVDAYTCAGSMNGNAILEAAERPLGAWFRQSHPGKPFPLWLAQSLQFESGQDPGHDDDWRDIPGALKTGRLQIDLAQRGFVGFLFHLTRAERPDDAFPTGAWFDPDAGAREIDGCPAGIPASVEDPDLVSRAQEWSGEERPAPATPPDNGPILEVFSRFAGTFSKPLKSAGQVPLPLGSAWLAWAVPALCSDGVPRPELLVELPRNVEWSAGEAEGLRVERMTRGARIGVTANNGGWALWRSMSALANVLKGLPDGATIDLALAPPVDEDEEDGPTGVGKALFAGPVRDGQWRIDRAHPLLEEDALASALAFARELFEERRIVARTPAELEALEASMQEWGDFVGEDAKRVGEGVHFATDDVRTAVLIAGPVFRARFAEVFEMDEG